MTSAKKIQISNQQFIESTPKTKFLEIRVIYAISIYLKLCVIDLLFIRALAAKILFGVGSFINNLKKTTMKTTFITILTALAMSVAMAQTTVPNGDFENWADPYNITDWDGLNYNGGIINFHTFSQTDDAHSGDYAAQVETISQPLIGALPGIAFTGNIEFDPTTFEYSFNLGVPVEGRPSELKGYYKYEPASGDSMAIVVGMFKWNEEQQDLDSIGGGLFFTGNTANSYTEFSAPIQYFNQVDEADTMYIMMFSSLDSYHVGSKLKVDDLTLEYGTTGIDGKSSVPDISVYPNPATDYINVDSNGQINEANLIITDLYGRQVFQKSFYGGLSTPLPETMGNGFYLANIVQENLIIKSTKICVRR